MLRMYLYILPSARWVIELANDKKVPGERRNALCDTTVELYITNTGAKE